MEYSIKIIYNKKGFEYDVYGIVRAFYDYSYYIIKEAYNEDIDKSFDINIVININNDIRIFFYVNDKLESQKTSLQNFKDRDDLRNELKRLLYILISNYEKKELPWGTLTGIRPTKIGYKLVNKSENKDDILEYYKKEYLTSDKKAELEAGIAIRSYDLLSKYKKGEYGVYISIPLCPSVCSYCSFTLGTYKSNERFIDDYIDSLIKDFKAIVELNTNKRIACIYIGGGTPSGLSNERLIKLLDGLNSIYNLNSIDEFTFEAGRPETIDIDLIKALNQYGVNRLSINPQTMNQETLNKINRKHNIDDIYKAFSLAKGFIDSINSDVILGLPDENINDMKNTVNILKKLGVHNITVHALSLKRGSKLYEEKYIHDSELSINDVNSLYEELELDGYKPYYLYRQKNIALNLENIGFSLEGMESLYNIIMIEEKMNVFGIGAGASTKLIKGELVKRVESVKDIKLYLERREELLERKINALEEL